MNDRLPRCAAVEVDHGLLPLPHHLDPGLVVADEVAARAGHVVEVGADAAVVVLLEGRLHPAAIEREKGEGKHRARWVEMRMNICI